MKILTMVAMPLVLALASGCASLTSPLDADYRLGDNVARYCESADEDVRAAGRSMAARAGLTLPNLCAAHALVDGEVEPYDDEI